MQRQLKVSERRACRVLGQPRGTQRFVAQRPDRDRALRHQLQTLAQQHPRRGYRFMWALLRRMGWSINRKRVQRLWRHAGLRVPGRSRKRHRLATPSATGLVRQRAAHPNHVWSYDFLFDQTEDGAILKMLPILDECSRESYTILVERRITAADVIRELERLFRIHGAPDFLRSDNGPEFIAKAIKQWLATAGVKTLYIEPGSPWENPYSESFNSRFRDELLNQEVFTSLSEAKVLVEAYRVSYNDDRPHSSLGYVTPAEFRAQRSIAAGAPRAFGASAHPGEQHGKKPELVNLLS